MYVFQCNAEMALNDFITQVCPDEWLFQESTSKLIAILGGGCVTDLEQIIQTIDQWKLPLVSSYAYVGIYISVSNERDWLTIFSYLADLVHTLLVYSSNYSYH